MEILNKEQFLEAVKDDPTLLMCCDRCNNNGKVAIMFSRCSELFSEQEYYELCEQYTDAIEHYYDLVNDVAP